MLLFESFGDEGADGLGLFERVLLELEQTKALTFNQLGALQTSGGGATDDA